MYFDKGTLFMLSSSRREIQSVDVGLSLLRRAKSELHVPIAASVCGSLSNMDEWKNLCGAVAAAGADLIQLDLLYSFCLSAVNTESDFRRIVSLANEVQDITGRPVAVKLNAGIPTDNIITNLKGKKIGVTLLDSIKVGIPPCAKAPGNSCFRGVTEHAQCLATGRILYPLALLYTQELRKHGVGPICSGGGVFTGDDAASLLLSGADVVQVATAICVYGFGVIENIISRLDELSTCRSGWFNEKGGMFLESLGFSENKIERGKVEPIDVSKCEECVERTCQKTVMCGSGTRACEGCGLCIDVCPKKNEHFVTGD
jgi:dihydroorotate dehydrogenase